MYERTLIVFGRERLSFTDGRVFYSFAGWHMRVVSGDKKGFELQAPKGTVTRPTSDKVRDAIFNVIGERVSSARILDLYAGTGALAIEALSRGARSADLVESNDNACASIRANLQRTGLEARAKLWRLPVARCLKKLEPSFGLILADPPYAAEDIQKLMGTLGEGLLLDQDTLVVLEHGKRFDTLEGYGMLRRWKVKQYGDTAVSFFEVVGVKT